MIVESTKISSIETTFFLEIGNKTPSMKHYMYVLFVNSKKYLYCGLSARPRQYVSIYNIFMLANFIINSRQKSHAALSRKPSLICLSQ